MVEGDPKVQEDRDPFLNDGRAVLIAVAHGVPRRLPRPLRDECARSCCHPLSALHEGRVAIDAALEALLGEVLSGTHRSGNPASLRRSAPSERAGARTHRTVRTPRSELPSRSPVLLGAAVCAAAALLWSPYLPRPQQPVAGLADEVEVAGTPTVDEDALSNAPSAADGADAVGDELRVDGAAERADAMGEMEDQGATGETKQPTGAALAADAAVASGQAAVQRGAEVAGETLAEGGLRAAGAGTGSAEGGGKPTLSPRGGVRHAAGAGRSSAAAGGGPGRLSRG